jgi:hypothetical protein
MPAIKIKQVLAFRSRAHHQLSNRMFTSSRYLIHTNVKIDKALSATVKSRPFNFQLKLMCLWPQCYESLIRNDRELTSPTDLASGLAAILSCLCFPTFYEKWRITRSENLKTVIFQGNVWFMPASRDDFTGDIVSLNSESRILRCNKGSFNLIACHFRALHQHQMIYLAGYGRFSSC